MIVATLGRREAAEDLVADLLAQTRRPDRTLFAVIDPDDAPESDPVLGNETLVCEHKGSCHQRNRAIDIVAANSDLLVFFDDDFVPDRHYLERLHDAFESDPSLVGATGLVVADGVNGPGLSRDEALAAIRGKATDFPGGDLNEKPVFGLYGCNMAVRASALGDRRFDEALPLYGWMEDLDLTNQLLAEGELRRIDRLVGAHRGIKAGRTSGVRLGYSQVANSVYLIRKGTAPKRPMYENIAKYLIVNGVKSIWPEPFVDRRGRLKGNLVGMLDWIRGRSRPDRILEL
ncbi:glycosyltransferase family 2 protein [Erythrobacter sp. THAF29]|uniref:glycosyltransferase family 2 protein n=1 Tax=Erythrobacter sp. THAF29 TaxID=2587851 RepID=UPI001562B292|nr:glycosyltransferase family A protein [Erythrobacter sp. THAF29]